MVKIKTESGFECLLPENANDDMELVDIFMREYPNEYFRNADILNNLLGDQKQALYDHLRKIYGKVPATAVSKEIQDIFLSFGAAGKNS